MIYECDEFKIHSWKVKTLFGIRYEALAWGYREGKQWATIGRGSYGEEAFKAKTRKEAKEKVEDCIRSCIQRYEKDLDMKEEQIETIDASKFDRESR